MAKDCVLPFRLWISGALEAEGRLRYFGDLQQDGDSFSPALIANSVGDLKERLNTFCGRLLEYVSFLSAIILRMPQQYIDGYEL